MIIVLEGVNGTGKSTLARALSRAYHAQILRAFRPDDLEFHFNGQQRIERQLKALDVPYNTHVEDLYIADTLGQLLKTGVGRSLTVILDRSVPSALAYGSRPMSDATTLLSLWQELLAPAGPLAYLSLSATHSVACQRLAADRRHDERRHCQLSRSFSFLFELLEFKHKLEIDTSNIQASDALERAMKLVSDAQAG